jgi:hypothetical protein
MTSKPAYRLKRAQVRHARYHVSIRRSFLGRQLFVDGSRRRRLMPPTRRAARRSSKRLASSNLHLLAVTTAGRGTLRGRNSRDGRIRRRSRSKKSVYTYARSARDYFAFFSDDLAAVYRKQVPAVSSHLEVVTGVWGAPTQALQVDTLRLRIQPVMLGIADATLGTSPLFSAPSARDEYGLRIQSFAINWQHQGNPRALTELTYDRIIMDQLRSPASSTEVQRLGSALQLAQRRTEVITSRPKRPKASIEAG